MTKKRKQKKSRGKKKPVLFTEYSQGELYRVRDLAEWWRQELNAYGAEHAVHNAETLRQILISDESNSDGCHFYVKDRGALYDAIRGLCDGLSHEAGCASRVHTASECGCFKSELQDAVSAFEEMKAKGVYHDVDA